MWIYQCQHWPDFTWDTATLTAKLADVRHRQGRLLGRMESLGFELQREANLSTLTHDVVKSSAIEGERLNREQVRSSIARKLGIESAGRIPAGRDVEGIVEMMLDATQRCFEPLSQQRLFDWHAALFPTGRRGMHRITVGGWLEWFLDCLGRAIAGAETTLGNILFKARLWDAINQKPVNARQCLIINRMLEADFKGYLNTSKYAKLAKCSTDTALRDIRELKDRGILIQNSGGGRSTSYRLPEPLMEPADTWKGQKDGDF